MWETKQYMKIDGPLIKRIIDHLFNKKNNQSHLHIYIKEKTIILNFCLRMWF